LKFVTWDIGEFQKTRKTLRDFTSHEFLAIQPLVIVIMWGSWCCELHLHSIIHTEIANKLQQCIKIYYSMFIRGPTCFGRHTAHHQELKTALAASGFAYVRDCWTLRLLDRWQYGTCAVHVGWYLRLQIHTQCMWYLLPFHCNSSCTCAS
jgi:hypothetical protein